MKTAIIVTACGVFVICVLLHSLWFRAREADKVEYARRLVSKGAQKKLFSALVRYTKERGCIPERLDCLVDNGYVTSRDILALRIRSTKPEHPIDYWPESYGDPNAILFADVRPWKSRFGSKLKSARVVTYGTGETRIEQLPNIAKGKKGTDN